MDWVSSPLKVRHRRNRIWAEDGAGRAVVDGTTREHWPDRFVCGTPVGEWRINAKVDEGGQTYLPVLNPGGGESARIGFSRREWSLLLPTGDVAAVTSGGGMIQGMHCAIGDLSTAVAPRLAPQRYITVTLSPGALAHACREVIAVTAVWISEMQIANLINDAGGGD
jgi:hypothetical protein